MGGRDDDAITALESFFFKIDRDFMAKQPNRAYTAIVRLMGLYNKKGWYDDAIMVGEDAIDLYRDIKPGIQHVLDRAMEGKRKQQQQEGEEPQGEARVHFITYATSDSCHLDRLLVSARSHGVDINILRPPPDEKRWVWLNKLRLLKDFLLLPQIHPHDYVCAMDGYDVIMAGGEKEVLRTFRRLNSTILFSAESYFFCERHDCLLPYQLAPPSPTPYRYLNAGGFMGQAKALLTLISHLEADLGMTLSMKEPCCPPGLEKADDQILLFTHYVTNRGTLRHLISLDYYQELFAVQCNMCTRDVSVLGGRLHNHQTDTLPLILHGEYIV